MTVTYKTESIKIYNLTGSIITDEVIFNAPNPNNVISLIFKMQLPFQSINIAEVYLYVTFGVDMNGTCHTLPMGYFETWIWCEDVWKKGVEYRSPNLIKLFIFEVKSNAAGNFQSITLRLSNSQYELQLSNYSRLEIKYNAPLNGINLLLMLFCLKDFISNRHYTSVC